MIDTDYRTQALTFYLQDAQVNYKQANYSVVVALCHVILVLDPQNSQAIELCENSTALLNKGQ